MTDRTTIVHVMRHGEVHNPERHPLRPAARLPPVRPRPRPGRRRSPSWLARRDIVYVVASPLERAQETAAPIAATHGLAVDTDDELIESHNVFQGERVSPGRRRAARPAQLVAPAQPAHAVVG